MYWGSFTPLLTYPGHSLERSGGLIIFALISGFEGVIMVLEICVFATVLVGFLGLLYKRNLIMKEIAMDAMSTGVIAYYVLSAARRGVFTPILIPQRQVDYADPVPQAVSLTAIVIGLSIQALMLVGVMKLSRAHPTLDVRDIELKNSR